MIYNLQIFYFYIVLFAIKLLDGESPFKIILIYTSYAWGK